MTKSEAIDQIQKICIAPNDSGEEDLLKLEAILKKYLKNHPRDSDMWVATQHA